MSQREIKIMRKEYTYKYILENNIPINYGIKSLIFSKNDLDADMSLLKNITSIKPAPVLKFLDFESVAFVDRQLKEKISNNCVLVDDSLRINREYIDLTKIKNIDLTIPLDYLVWGVKFNDKVNTYCFKYCGRPYGTYRYLSINGNTSLSLTDLKKIRKTIE